MSTVRATATKKKATKTVLQRKKIDMNRTNSKNRRVLLCLSGKGCESSIFILKWAVYYNKFRILFKTQFALTCFIIIWFGFVPSSADMTISWMSEYRIVLHICKYQNCTKGLLWERVTIENFKINVFFLLLNDFSNSVFVKMVS